MSDECSEIDHEYLRPEICLAEILGQPVAGNEIDLYVNHVLFITHK